MKKQKTIFTKSIFLAVAAVFFSATAFSQIATWDIYQLHGTWGGDPEVYTPKTPVADSAPGVASAGVTVSPLTISSTMLARSTNSDDADLLGVDGLNSSCFDFATAKTEGNYLECTITPVSGKSVTITSIDISAVSSGDNGVCSLTSSVDAHAVALDTINLGTANHINIHPLRNFTVAGHTALTAPVTFRFYFHAAAQWGLEYSHVGIGNRHSAETTYDLIVNGLVDDAITSIAQNKLNNVSVYAHNSQIIADLTAVNGASTVSVIDTKGSVIKTIQSAGAEMLTINVANKGIYLVQVNNAGKTSTLKVAL